VVVTQGGSEIRADAMAYDNLARVLDLKGRVRAVLTSPTGARP
jgi:lipopolysaccharide export system protein LptA